LRKSGNDDVDTLQLCSTVRSHLLQQFSQHKLIENKTTLKRLTIENDEDRIRSSSFSYSKRQKLDDELEWFNRNSSETNVRYVGQQWLSGKVSTSRSESWVFDPRPLRELP